MLVSLQGLGDLAVVEDKVIAGHDRRAVNGPDGEPVARVDGSGAGVASGQLSAAIAPLSYRMIPLS